ncbi:MAG: 30S ribosome-binding factor RbfA [Flavobacteriales bacterium]|nr:30S ribosome-binding factor RbfA [Flavobacteriales bacterium]
MATIRQEKISAVIKRDLSAYFQQEARTLCQGAMVTVTIVRVSPDLSLARVYLSIFAGPDKKVVLKNIQENAKAIRHNLSQKVKQQMRKTPELAFFLDDSLDYAEEIDKLLKD